MSATQNSTVAPSHPPDPSVWWSDLTQKCRDAAMAFSYGENPATAEVFTDAAHAAELVLDELEILEGLRGEG